ncbi:MAG: hypothetical protein HKN87_13585 [Saprospiraceae bacterium]|nr:hypothetical protein [Saprospiraceae bacterium]
MEHFLGWEVELADSCFDSSAFIMMDYRLRYQDSTSFTYVLPFSDRHALIEYTFFTSYLLKEDVYEDLLRQYLHKYLGSIPYQIRRTEQGVIPMTDYAFGNDHKRNLKKIETAGGWVRPSSGYSFSASGRYVDQIIKNIVRNRDIAPGVAQNRWRWYDRIFLHILQHNNVLGQGSLKRCTKTTTSNC